MKLKYYLRGLAVGIILTTLVLSIANSDNKPMTDAQIRQKAFELGMVESDSLKLTDVVESSNDMSEEISNESDSSIATKESDEVPESSKAKEETQSTEIIQSIEETQNAEETSVSSDGAVDASVPPASTDGAADASVPPASDVGDVVVPVVITIKSGDSSYTVSKALAAAGLVEDAVEFDDYLCDNGYSRKIRTGTYELKVGMSYGEIAKTIAG